MKIISTVTAAMLTFATAASAGTVEWGFKSTNGPADRDTNYLWEGVGINISDDNDMVTLNITGLDQFDFSTDSVFEAWFFDFAMDMDAGNSFDIIINPGALNPDNTCNVLVTQFMFGWDPDNNPMQWDHASHAGGGYCSIGEDNFTLTANIPEMPLPAGMLLMLTGLGAVGLAKKRRS